ncbi:hypothetical protein BYT27DRAFT_7095918, partial [Phlegmacium glaucopus]
RRTPGNTRKCQIPKMGFSSGHNLAVFVRMGPGFLPKFWFLSGYRDLAIFWLKFVRIDRRSLLGAKKSFLALGNPPEGHLRENIVN